MDERTFLQGYDPAGFPSVAVTVDVVALTIRDGRLHVLLVERGGHPFAGWRALPGGFVRDEALDAAALRELAEETGLRPGEGALDRVHLEQLRSYGDPGRDPRMRVVSVAYLAFAPSLPDPEPGTDARRPGAPLLASAEGAPPRPCSSHVYHVALIFARCATSSRRRPAVRRRPPLSPNVAGSSLVRRFLR